MQWQPQLKKLCERQMRIDQKKGEQDDDIFHNTNDTYQTLSSASFERLPLLYLGKKYEALCFWPRESLYSRRVELLRRLRLADQPTNTIWEWS